MDKVKLAVATALFLFLTALKLLYPAGLDFLRQEAVRLGATEKDYKAAVTALGRGLTDRELGEKLVAVFREYTNEETGENTP